MLCRWAAAEPSAHRHNKQIRAHPTSRSGCGDAGLNSCPCTASRRSRSVAPSRPSDGSRRTLTAHQSSCPSGASTASKAAARMLRNSVDGTGADVPPDLRFRGCRRLLTEVVAGARWDEGLPRRGGRRAALRRGRPVPCRRLLPRRRQRRRQPIRRHARTARRAPEPTWTATTYERWVAGYDVETGAAKGRLRTDDQGGAVRRGHRQRAEDLVAGGRAAPRDRGGVRRRADGGGRGDHRLARRARDDPGRAARPPGAGAGRADRGGRRTALHLPGRRPAPAPAPPDQRPGLRRPARGVGCTRSACATASRRSTGSGTRP